MALGRATVIIHRHAVDRYVSRCGADPTRARFDLIRLAHSASPARERTPRQGDAYWLCTAALDDPLSPTAPVLIVKRDAGHWHVVSVLSRTEWDAHHSHAAGGTPDEQARAEAESLGISLSDLEPVPDAWGFKPNVPLADRVSSLKARCTRLVRANEEMNLRLIALISEHRRLLDNLAHALESASGDTPVARLADLAERVHLLLGEPAPAWIRESLADPIAESAHSLLDSSLS